MRVCVRAPARTRTLHVIPKGTFDEAKVIPNHPSFLEFLGFHHPQSRKTSAPCLSPPSSLCFRGLPGEPSVVGTGTRSPPLPSVPGITPL